MQGVWSREELRSALEVGCAVETLDGWVHRSAWHPFAPWWEAVRAGGAAGTEPPAGVAVAPVLADAAPSARAGSRPALNLISTPTARLNSSKVSFILKNQ